MSAPAIWGEICSSSLLNPAAFPAWAMRTPALPGRPGGLHSSLLCFSSCSLQPLSPPRSGMLFPYFTTLSHSLFKVWLEFISCFLFSACGATFTCVMWHLSPLPSIPGNCVCAMGYVILSGDQKSGDRFGAPGSMGHSTGSYIWERRQGLKPLY